MRRTLPFALALATLVGAGGCSTDRHDGELFGPSEAGLVVVDAVLIVGDALPVVRVTRSVEPDRMPTDADAERGADVTVRWETGVMTFEEIPGIPGLYRPDRVAFVQPETTYRLSILTTDEERVTATTTTPPPFSVESWVLLDDADQSVAREFATFDAIGDSVYTTPQNQAVYATGLLEARFDRPGVPAFQVGLFSLDLDSDFVIDPDFFDEENFEDLERNNASPPLEGGDGSLRLPWFAVFFEGRYLIKIFALDTNWYDLVRSDPDFSGGGPGFGGPAGDSFQKPIFHVDGGIGLFGSASVDSLGLNVHPR